MWEKIVKHQKLIVAVTLQDSYSGATQNLEQHTSQSAMFVHNGKTIPVKSWVD